MMNPRFYKKGIGRRLVETTPEETAIRDMAEVRISGNDYFDLLSKTEADQVNFTKMKEDLQSESKYYKKLYESERADLSKARKEIQRLTEEVLFQSSENTELKEKLQAQEDLNKNLLRISRERANQERDVPDKKHHDG